jgi:Patatin-like phospholipase
MKYKEFDLIISGGGICGYGHLGAINILKNKKDIEIRKIYATSAGVIVALFFLSNMSYDEAINTYNLLKNYDDNIHKSIMKMLREKLNKDIHIKCNEKLNICLTKITDYGLFTKEIINQFENFEHLLLVVEASINIPFLITEKPTIINGNKYFDGGIFANTPNHNLLYPQLVMKTNEFTHPITYRFNLNSSQEQICSLVSEGLNKFNDFIITNENNNIYYWHKNNNFNIILFVNICLFTISYFNPYK